MEEIQGRRRAPGGNPRDRADAAELRSASIELTPRVRAAARRYRSDPMAIALASRSSPVKPMRHGRRGYTHSRGDDAAKVISGMEITGMWELLPKSRVAPVPHRGRRPEDTVGTRSSTRYLSAASVHD